MSSFEQFFHFSAKNNPIALKCALQKHFWHNALSHHPPDFGMRTTWLGTVVRELCVAILGFETPTLGFFFSKDIAPFEKFVFVSECFFAE